MSADLLVVQQNGWALEYVQEQTKEMCLVAVRQCGWALQFVLEQTPDICMEAIQYGDCETLKYVKEQTREICMTAMRRNGWALQFVKEQTHEICLAAVQQNGHALQFVRQQTPELCLEAVLENEEALQHVELDQEEIRRLVLETNLFGIPDMVGVVYIKNCVICMVDEKPGEYGMACGHACICAGCALECIDLKQCPMCRHESNLHQKRGVAPSTP